MTVIDCLSRVFQGCIDFILSLFRKNDAIYFPTSQISVTIPATAASNIGEGAFSTVFKVKDQNASKQYALKQMIIQSSEYSEIARIEVEAFQRFHHKYLLRMLDSMETQHKGHKTIFLLLPYYSKGSLRQYLNQILDCTTPKPSLQIVLKDFKHICEGLLVLHNYQPSYVHQDIKPEVRKQISFQQLSCQPYLFSYSLCRMFCWMIVCSLCSLTLDLFDPPILK
jgi:dGTP triphosphohydrolase